MTCTAASKCFNNSKQTTAVALADTHDCSIQKCPKEWDACKADAKCAGVIHNCAQTCTDAEQWKKCLEAAHDPAAVNLMRCGLVNHCYDEVRMEEFH